ncbi:pentapeptide repeat-containing protein, partial [uncultured Demequina sp.]|uniref:pentapeptide repeat-containing protein n=1 Tax=uncultured Demequina sp. TaxID=693499 RepID=UPI0025EC83AA
EPGDDLSGLSERSPFVHISRIPEAGPGQRNVDPSDAINSKAPLDKLVGSITPADLHYERSHAGVPMLDPATHRLLIHGMAEKQLVLTMDDGARELAGVDIRLSNGVIAEIGAALDPVGEIVDASGCLVTPGLVNTHHHLYQTLTRAVPGGQDALLFGWLKTLYPIWARFGSEDMRISALAGLAELALSGCTLTSDHLYLFPNGARLDDTIDAARENSRNAHDEALSNSLFVRQGVMNGADVLPFAGLYLDEAQLSGLTLDGADFADATLTGAELKGSSLRNAVLAEADLTGADLTDADLTGADLSEAMLADADLTGATLTEVLRDDASLDGAWYLASEPPAADQELLDELRAVGASEADEDDD